MRGYVVLLRLQRYTFFCICNKKIGKNVCGIRKSVYLCTALGNKHGALAHLARAFDWQSRGGEFESRMLHKG